MQFQLRNQTLGFARHMFHTSHVQLLLDLRDRELDGVLLNTFYSERKWKLPDGSLKLEVDTEKRRHLEFLSDISVCYH